MFYSRSDKTPHSHRFPRCTRPCDHGPSNNKVVQCNCQTPTALQTLSNVHLAMRRDVAAFVRFRLVRWINFCFSHTNLCNRVPPSRNSLSSSSPCASHTVFVVRCLRFDRLFSTLCWKTVDTCGVGALSLTLSIRFRLVVSEALFARLFLSRTPLTHSSGCAFDFFFPCWDFFFSALVVFPICALGVAAE